MTATAGGPQPDGASPGSVPATLGAPAGSAVTVRAVLLGALLCVAIGLIGPYWTFYLQTSTLFLDYSVAGGIFLLFLVVVSVNGVLGVLVPPLALRRGELTVVAAMVLVAGAIVTMGLVGYLIPNITAPYYLATPYNEWSTELWPHLKTWMSPLDPDGRTTAIKRFFTGVNPGEPMPWRPWVKPLAIWSILLVGLWAARSPKSG